MSNIKYERHLMENPALPIIFHDDVVRRNLSGVVNWHDNTEFLHCTGGEGIVHCDSHSFEMKEGDTIIVNARCIHSISSESHVKYHCLIVDNSFFKDNGIDIENIVFNEKIRDDDAAKKMHHVSSCIKNHGKEFYIAHARLALLDYICYITDNFSHKKLTKSAKISKSYTAVLDTIEYINNNFSEKLTLEDIAARAGFSKFHFSRIFKENTGITVIEHINARRCDRARFMLRETDKLISEISAACGFESQSYFAKTFSASCGLLPSEYRKKYSKI